MNKNTRGTACKKTSIGGQALIEGIMMRGPEQSAMAVRNAKGEIVLEKFETKNTKSKITKIPFVRGIFNMIFSFTVGYKCLMRSADIAITDAEEQDRIEAEKKKQIPSEHNNENAAESTNVETAQSAIVTPEQQIISDKNAECENIQHENISKENSETEGCQTVDNTITDSSNKEDSTSDKEKKQSSALTTLVMVIGIVFGIALSVGLFIVLPSYSFKGLAALCNFDGTKNNYGMQIARSAFEGVMKIIILVIYMLLVSKMKDIRRTFMYHGAEHKTIFCYEQGLELTVDNIRGQRRFHPRCGTSFIILVVLVSIFIGIFIPGSIPVWARSLIKILLLPLTIGVGYELIRLAGRKDNALTRIISKPGMWLQHITTVEPDDSMIECAIAAMNEVIPEDKNKDNW